MRIFVADGNRDVRLSVQILVNHQPDMNVIGIAVRSDGLVEQVEATKPDLLLLNWDLPGRSLPDMVARLRTLLPQLKLVVMSVRTEARSAALAAGADTFISMNTAPEKLLETMRTVGSSATGRSSDMSDG